MKSLLLWITAMLSLLLAFSANADNNWRIASKQELVELATQLKGENKSLQETGTFQQEKKFPYLNNPIISSGRYQRVGKPEPTIIWQTESPIYNQLQIKKDSIYQQLELDGESKLLIENQGIATTLFELLSGDLIVDSNANWKINDSQCLLVDETAISALAIFKQIQVCFYSANTAFIMEDSAGVITTVKITRDVNNE